jgi:hypothetical protein
MDFFTKKIKEDEKEYTFIIWDFGRDFLRKTDFIRILPMSL